MELLPRSDSVTDEEVYLFDMLAEMSYWTQEKVNKVWADSQKLDMPEGTLGFSPRRDEYTEELLIEEVEKLFKKFVESVPKLVDSSTYSDSDAQMYIVEMKGDKLCFACRGTESFSDAMTDLDATQEELKDVIYDNNWKHIDGFNPDEKPEVHSGFNQQYNTIKFRIYAELFPYLHDNRDKDREVIFCGHSLGGALAVIGSASVGVHFKPYKFNLTCFTYGCPRVGNKAFAQLHNTLVSKAYRGVNNMDPVPMYPRLGNWYHCKGLEHFDKDGGRHEDNEPYSHCNSILFKIFKVTYIKITNHLQLSYLRNTSAKRDGGESVKSTKA